VGGKAVVSMPVAVGAIASVVGAVVGTVTAVVVPIVTTVAATIGPIVASVGSLISGVTTAISSTVSGLWTGIKTAVTPLVEALKAGIKTIAGAIDKATAPILNPIKDGLALVHAKLKAIDAWMAAELTIVHDVIQIASAAATVKLLVDLVKGQASISEVIDKVAEGKSFETAVAIAELSKSIVTLGVGMVDTIDTHWELIETTIDTWDEQFKRELAAAIKLQKAELLAVVTPKMTTLGRNQQMVIKGIARISRHIEDESWFVAMFLRMLR